MNASFGVYGKHCEVWKKCHDPEEPLEPSDMPASCSVSTIIRDKDLMLLHIDKHLVSSTVTLLHWRVAKGISPNCIAVWIIGGSYRYRSIIGSKWKITGEWWHPAHLSRQIRPSLEHATYSALTWKERRIFMTNAGNQHVPACRASALKGWKPSSNSMATSPLLLCVSAVSGRCPRQSAWRMRRQLVKIPKCIEGWSYYHWNGLYANTLHRRKQWMFP